MVLQNIINETQCYEKAEQKAFDYFQRLLSQVQNKQYVENLLNETKRWKKRYMLPKTSYFKRKNTQLFHWLKDTGELDDYLKRSISYIYLRDLGKKLDDEHTVKRINEVLNTIKNQMLKEQQLSNQDYFHKSNIYRIAQKEGIETTAIWLFEKLEQVIEHLPEEMDTINAQRKLLKIIAGVYLHFKEDLEHQYDEEERKEKLAAAIRLGYSYGLTYPFIDDLLDSKILTDEEQMQFSNSIRNALITGEVPTIHWTGKNKKLLDFVQKELKECFHIIKNNHPIHSSTHFYEQAYIFFHSQEIDRLKDLQNPHYTNEQLYIPVILKSASSRLIARSLINKEKDDGFHERTFLFGIYNQLSDDFTDLEEDLKNGVVTPYTYYVTYHNKRKDLINPFELFWIVIMNLIDHVYDGNEEVCELLLTRAFNGLKRMKEKKGAKHFKSTINFFCTFNENFKKELEKIVQNSKYINFYDKYLRDEMIFAIKNDNEKRDEFFENIRVVREKINQLLPLEKDRQDAIVNAANYSLEGRGKRFRPLLTYLTAVHLFSMKEKEIIPLLKALEYMHNASLIFDDLPSQDNASYRRGRKTLHEKESVAIAELTGLFLIQKAYEEISSMTSFNSTNVLQAIQYTAKTTSKMCKGQAIDLQNNVLTIEELKDLSYLKTGIGIEASLWLPAILANATEEYSFLKNFSYHAGIAFQIKDDLLDIESDFTQLGKPVRLDLKNERSTFVTLLGVEGAKKELWNQYCLAFHALQNTKKDVAFLKYFLDYIVFRKS